MELKEKKILVTGGAGFLGKFVIEKLIGRGVATENIFIPREAEFDLRNREQCLRATEGQDIVIHLAGKAGGIGFNRERPGELFYDNIVMGVELMEAARKAGAGKFVGIASVCSYPKFTPVPFREDDLWSGYPEETNAPYGLAKKMLLVQAQAYRAQYGMNAITLFPVNLYGPGDSFDLSRAHVISSLIKKVADAKKENNGFIEAWGSGKPTREFLYVEDAAEGIALAAEKYDKPEPVNLGSGKEISIKELAETICRLMDFRGELRWDASKPDGQPRRQLDVSRAEKEFGFKAKTDFETGLKKTIEWYMSNN
ncbi:MAG: GDP-L-fucose synthase [Candidatus Liptonbacteria bacterium]|nr:GDP-L-fucose synthase [Candidatus Liptonbacteria bacterium]